MILVNVNPAYRSSELEYVLGQSGCRLLIRAHPRAIRRACAHDPELPLDVLIARAGGLLDAVALLPLDRAVLAAAGVAPAG